MSSLESSLFPVENIILLLLLLTQGSVGLERNKLVVQPHPVQFNEEPHNWTVTKGTSVSLTCSTTVVQVIGYIDEDTTPLPQIRWFHNDVMINSTDHFTIINYGIDTSTLTIRNVTSLEQGEYHCVVNEWKQNDDWWIKTRSKSGYIRVIGNDSTITINIKENVALSCMEPATVVPQSGVVWIKNGTKLSENVTVMMFEGSKDSSGDYQCIDQVNNITLFRYTVVAAFSTYLQQQKLLIQDMNKENHFISISHSGPIDGCDTSLVNQSVTMKCLASGHMSVTWYKNGEVLELSSEGTMYNQTSGELVIRREDACELLGVYQCFASNDIDTVHVSTRVLPFGWPNRPGRPELIDFQHKFVKFELKIMVHPPDYLAGLAIEDLSYNIYLADAENFSTVHLQQIVNASIASNDGVRVQLRKDFINDLNIFLSVYYLTVSIKYTNKELSNIIGLPGRSPQLAINTICTFFESVPGPKVMGTCEYDNSSGLMTHNISWYVASVFESISYKFHNDYWYVTGGCTYPNGTSAGMKFSRHFFLKEYHTWDLPRNSVCTLLVEYETPCGKKAASNFTADYCDDDGDDDSDGINEPSKLEGSNNMPVVVTTSLSAVLVVIISVSIILMYFCYRKYSHRKQSALRMLKNVEEINQLQANCPISIDQESAYGQSAKSELYIEKVNRWMEYIPEADLESVLDGCSLGASEMLDQIVEGKITKTAQLTLANYIQDELTESSDKTSSPRICSIKESSDSSLECGGKTPSTVVSSNLFWKNCQIGTNGISVDSPESNNEPMLCDKLLETSYHGDDHKVFGHLLSKSVDKYFDSNGLEVIDQEKCLPKSAEKYNYVGLEVFDQDQCLPRSTEQFGLEVIDQDQCLPRLPEKFEYVGLNVIDQDQCLSKSIKIFDHVGLEIIDQDQLPKSAEKFDYVGLEIINPDQCLPESTEKFKNFELEVEHVNQDQCLSTSMENFDYIGLELADQDQCHLHSSPGKISESNIEAKSKCIPKSAENLSNCTEAEADQNYSPSKSTEKVGNYVELEAIDHQDHHANKAFVDSVKFNKDHQPSLTSSVNDQYCTCCAYIPAENPACCYSGLNDQSQKSKTFCYQSGHKEFVGSSIGHEAEANDNRLHEKKHYLQYNKDGYVTNPVLTGQYCI